MKSFLIEFLEENQTFENRLSNAILIIICIFYDGPPFITGMPAAPWNPCFRQTKDAVPFWTMRKTRGASLGLIAAGY